MATVWTTGAVVAARVWTTGVAVVATVWTTGAVVAARVWTTGVATAPTRGVSPARVWTTGVAVVATVWTTGAVVAARVWTTGVAVVATVWTTGAVVAARVWTTGVAVVATVWTTGAVVAATVWVTGRAAALFTFTAAAVVDNTWLRGSAPLVSAAAGEAVDGDDPSTAAGVGGEEVDPTFVPMAEDADFAGSFMDGVAGVEGTRSEVVANDEPVTELTVPVTLEVRGVSSTPSAPAFPEQNNTTPMSAVNRPRIKNARHLHTRALLVRAFKLNLGGLPVAGGVLKGRTCRLSGEYERMGIKRVSTVR